MTVLLVTHDREEALSMSDRVALMFGGRIVQIGTPQQVYSRPESRRVADYFGNCVYLPGQVRGGVFTGGGLTCPVAVPDGSYDMMLRPDSLVIDGAGGYGLTVEAVTFRGGDTLLTLRAEDGTLWKRSHTGAVPWRTGDHLHAAVETEHAVLLLAE